MPDLLSSDKLCALLSIERGELLAWVKLGLPWTSDRPRKRFDWKHARFDAAAVERFLVSRELRRPARLVRTLADVATHFGVSVRAVGYWGDRGCPLGEEGARDLDAIAAWRSANYGTEEKQTSDRAHYETERSRTRAELEQLELEEYRGELARVSTLVRVLSRLDGEEKTQLEQLADWLLSILPSGLAAREKRRIRDAVRERIGQLCADREKARQELADELDSEK